MCSTVVCGIVTWDRTQVHNLSCENDFYLHENEKLFPYQRLSTYPRFETEVRENSEVAYCLAPSPVTVPEFFAKVNLDPVSLSFLKWRMKRPVSRPEKWGGGVGGLLFILLVNFTF